MSEREHSELGNLQRIVQLLERLVVLMEQRAAPPSYTLGDRWASTRHEPASGVGSWYCSNCSTHVSTAIHNCPAGLR